jgi:mannose-6-phosphate isomerase-like protein (cupin superfamily)
MAYTHKNLKQVKDSAPDFGFGDHQEAHFATDDMDAENTGLSYHVVRPDQRQGFGHRHENAEEIYVVLSGAGRAKLDDEIIEVEAMDAIRVAPQVARAFEAGPEGLELLAFGPRHEGDGELVQDFWPTG